MRRSRRALSAIAVVFATGATVAAAGVAGAADPATIYSVERGTTPCFSTVAGTCAPNSGDVTIETGDTVTWDFAASPDQYHNAHPTASNASTPPVAAWNEHDPDLQQGGEQTFKFGTPGVYRFYCEAHASMVGTVTVEGAPVATPTPTPTPTPTATATATATAIATPVPTTSGDDHTVTPAPGHAGIKDAAAPRLARAGVRRTARGARVRFWLSEPATVEITLRRARTTVGRATVQAPAGTRAAILRTVRLRSGSYRIELRATDAMGNRAVAATKTVKLK